MSATQFSIPANQFSDRFYIEELLSRFYDDDEIQEWLTNKHPLLGNLSPNWFIRKNHYSREAYDRVYSIVEFMFRDPDKYEKMFPDNV